MTEKEFNILDKKIKETGLSQQNYLYFAALSKPILKIDFTIFNNVCNEISEIENLLNLHAKNIDVTNSELLKLYVTANEKLGAIWHMLKELLYVQL